MTGLLRRSSEDRSIEEAELLLKRMLDGYRCHHRMLDTPSAVDQAIELAWLEVQPQLRAVDDRIERATVGDVECDVTEPRYLDLLIAQRDEGRHVAECDVRDVLAIH